MQGHELQNGKVGEIMPWVRKGNTVYKKEGGHLVKVGSSSSPEEAKRYLRALYAHDPRSSKNKKA